MPRSILHNETKENSQICQPEMVIATNHIENGRCTGSHCLANVTCPIVFAAAVVGCGKCSTVVSQAGHALSALAIEMRCGMVTTQQYGSQGHGWAKKRRD